MISYTTSHRFYTDTYGSGREVEITATATRIDTAELDEYELPPEAPWTIMLSGTETEYGAGSAVLRTHRADWDPNNEWRHDMRTSEPTEEECKTLAEDILSQYVDEHSE